MAKERDGAAPQRVVGIGASAGGLDALKQLVATIPADSGLAFVVLQHLPPSQTGLLAGLLAVSTKIPVLDAKIGHRIAPNTILVVPPHTSAGLSRGALTLRTTKGGGRPYLPIDGLFTSLAEVLGERAVGIVLSGTAHDGTEGLRAIQGVGGLTFAQEPSTAQFDDMPRSAIAAGVAEIVLPPAQIGRELGSIAKLARRGPDDKPGIERVLEQLREASGIDFTSYKRTTIERRLARRLAKLQLTELADYSTYLVAHPDEAKAVYEDLLVHVTEFFRDGRVFERLATLVFPELVRGKPPNAPFRVWVPGCSTGEEVYSIAIVLVELLGEDRQLQLFGSDLSERAIEAARRGHYAATIADQVSAERLQRFFRRDATGFRINRDIRERCVFVRHDLASDPPFSKLDLVSCRNLLIYMGPMLQKRVIPILHYALHQPGYLVLGPAETIAGFESMFETIDAEARIYERKPVARAALTFPAAGRLDRLPWRRVADTARSALDVQRDVDHVLLARYAPACVLVDDNLDVVQFRGRTGPYLEAPPGQPQLSLLRMAREGLASELPLAIERARRADAPVRQPNVVVRERGHDHVFHLEVIPLPGAIEARGYFLIVFEEIITAAPPARRTGNKTSRPREQGELVRVRQELAATKEYLHSVVTQHLATSEELGITNEELQSSNEELQSSNEELQTAKEELQSTNEELETVNEELQRGNQLLREANDDLVNVLTSVDIAIIIVDTDRRVRRYTPTARDVMRLIPGDVGRPIADLRTTVSVPGLDEAIAESIETLGVHESEVRHTDGRIYRMQIRPYRTEDHVISGAVIAFVDITALHAARDRAAVIVETVPTPLVVVDDRLHILSANGAFIAAFGIADPHDLTGRGLFDIGAWQAPDLRGRLEHVLSTGVAAADLEADHRGAAGERNLKLAANPIPDPDGRRTMLIGIADVTEHRRLEQAREAAKRERDEFLDAVSHELRTPLSAIVLWAQALRELEPDDPRRSQAVDTILSSARAEAELVDDLLELSTSRPATTKYDDATIPSTIVREIVDQSRQAADAKQIALTVQIEPALDAPMTTDSRQLRQITSELVGNAIKFTPAGGKVSVDLGVENGTMKLRVHDTGPGIPPEFVARAFEPFAQVDASTTRTHRGLGIGLARVRRFVESQGGVVDIDSPGDGLGTTFTVRLPTRS